MRPTQPPLRHRSNPVPPMTQQTPTRSFLKHSQPLLTKCLQAALIAAPVLVAAAPSEAYTVKTVVSGFTGEFAPVLWNRTPTSPNAGNTSSVDATSITLVKNPQNTQRVTASIDLTDSLFAALAPYQGVGRVVGWRAKGNYNWSITGTATNAKYLFGADSNNSADSPLNTSAPTSGSFSISDTYPDPLNPFDGNNNPDIVDFSVARVGSSATGAGTGVISNFEFVAEYEVPGPLPVVGAAAAFAWSRRLRKRLNPAKTLA